MLRHNRRLWWRLRARATILLLGIIGKSWVSRMLKSRGGQASDARILLCRSRTAGLRLLSAASGRVLLLLLLRTSTLLLWITWVAAWVHT